MKCQWESTTCSPRPVHLRCHLESKHLPTSSATLSSPPAGFTVAPLRNLEPVTILCVFPLRNHDRLSRTAEDPGFVKSQWLLVRFPNKLLHILPTFILGSHAQKSTISIYVTMFEVKPRMVPLDFSSVMDNRFQRKSMWNHRAIVSQYSYLWVKLTMV